MCKGSNNHSQLYALKLIPCFGQFSQIFKTKFSVQTLISQPNMNQIKCFIDHDLSWLTVNQKQIPILEIKDLVFMLRSIKQRAFFDSQCRSCYSLAFCWKNFKRGGGGVKDVRPLFFKTLDYYLYFFFVFVKILGRGNKALGGGGAKVVYRWSPLRPHLQRSVEN